MGDTSGRFDDLARKKFLTQINSGGKDMLVLINDVLDLSKVEADRLSCESRMCWSLAPFAMS